MKKFDADSDVRRWTKNHGVRITYQWRGADRTYVPDFLVESTLGILTLVEAKGYEYEPERCKLKYEAARRFCEDKGWIYRVSYQGKE